MKKAIFYLLILFSIITHSQTTISTILEDFSIVKVYNGIDLELVKSDEQRIEITGEKATKVKLKQQNGMLKILMRFPETTAEGNVKATLFLNKEIAVIDANEGAIVTGKIEPQSKIEVKAQEGAFMNLVVDVTNLEVKSSSGAVIKLSGKAKNETVKVDLGSIYHGYNLKTTNISTVKASSGAKAEIQTGETLNAKVTFGGSIFYHGNPKTLKEKKVIGGTIEYRN